ncbi:MAG: hypothetical protein AAFW69_10150 [Pseudomonadota bacterium]
MENAVWWSAAAVTGGRPGLGFVLRDPGWEPAQVLHHWQEPVERGEVPPSIDSPKVFRVRGAGPGVRRNEPRLPPLFASGGFVFAANAGVEVLKALGGPLRMVPATLLDSKGEKVEEPVEIVVPAAAKAAVQLSASPIAARLPWRSGRPRTLLSASRDFADADVVVSSVALDPPDIWVDPVYLGTLFFSAAAKTAVTEAGLERSFEFRSAPVI